MGKIICVIGKNATGKKTIIEILEERLVLRKIIMYTTRPIKPGEVDGRSYYFVTNKEYEMMRERGLVLESHTIKDNNKEVTYFTSSINFRLESNDYITENTPEGYEKLKEIYGEDTVIPIYIYSDSYNRLKRAILREQRRNNPNYEELCRLFIEEEHSFAQKDDYFKNKFYNDDLNKCVEEIYAYLKSQGIKDRIVKIKSKNEKEGI